MAITIGDLSSCCSCCARGLPCAGTLGDADLDEAPTEAEAGAGAAEDVETGDAESEAPAASSPMSLPKFKLSKKTKKKLGGKDVLFGAGGVSAGATAGALIGSVVPGIGTVIGALVGAAAGGVGGALFGKKKKKAKKKKQQQKRQALAAAEALRQRQLAAQQERAARLARLKLESLQRSIQSQADVLTRRGEMLADRAPLAASLAQDAQEIARGAYALDLDDPATPAALVQARQALIELRQTMLDAEKAGRTQVSGLGGMNPHLGAWLGQVRQANRVRAGLPAGRVPLGAVAATPSSTQPVCWIAAGLLVVWALAKR